MFEKDYIYNDYDEDYAIIKSSGLFDEEWYLTQYCEINFVDPIKHFLIIGCKNNFNPSKYFDMCWYLEQYVDVRNANINPFVHYIKYGRYEGRLTQPLTGLKYKSEYSIISASNMMDLTWFCKEYFLDDDVDPIVYYLENGVNLGLNPSRFFDTIWYLEQYVDVRNASINPFVHYIKYGRFEGRLPKPFDGDSKFKKEYYIILNSNLFDVNWFCEYYSLSNSVDPILYYLESGVRSGMNPSKDFDTLFYLENYPEIEDFGFHPFVHYIKYGRYEGKIPKLFEFSEIEDLSTNTLKGENNYFFLINDYNNELKQHFDNEYVNKFNHDVFINDYHSKKELFNKKEISYFFFIVPDKSVVLKDYVPFKKDNLKRNVDKIDCIPDFLEVLNEFCYWNNDTNLNYEGARKLVFNLLHHIDDNFNISDYEILISNCSMVNCVDPSNLLNIFSSNLSFKEIENINKVSVEYPIPRNIINLGFPNKFKSYGFKNYGYYLNRSSFSNLRAIILSDSSIESLKPYLMLYFREIFIYWNKLELSEELLEWYNPDIIIEIQIERFLESYSTPKWLKKV